MIKKILKIFGFNKKNIYSLIYLGRYVRDLKKWRSQGGNLDQFYMILNDYSDNSGTMSGHYFHQDLLVANAIFNMDPSRHVDIGSRVDGFVAHVASFRKIEVIDIRPNIVSVHPNISFQQLDFMSDILELKTDSLSCLHALEHFGLGRYGDSINVNGFTIGLNNLISSVIRDGTLYLSFPISFENKVCFNAHRILSPSWFLDLDVIKSNLILKRFDYVNDNGELTIKADPYKINEKLEYGCGIFTFQKKI